MPILNTTTCVVELQLETWMDEIQRQKGTKQVQEGDSNFLGEVGNMQ